MFMEVYLEGNYKFSTIKFRNNWEKLPKFIVKKMTENSQRNLQDFQQKTYKNLRKISRKISSKLSLKMFIEFSQKFSLEVFTFNFVSFTHLFTDFVAAVSNLN